MPPTLIKPVRHIAFGLSVRAFGIRHTLYTSNI